ncbi:MAG: flagellar basal-body rod protein FlgG [Candidatus Wallbacteria bacterium HGW-Wallbacteria-1]|jgi:flagellar basal-body rod protein FlgG|uniref:Flagellar basal-body rod protein FlgG n=1 Tax=Candidatus Wallbacteria bacterium HGW-Wallbacteria-1 TaxID=2013854 RepID=A0A2N1PTZ0_9BACT|nr:MAG: flagellar basal-body rod protein FlgG [Candidatus Wallbacteria bacterium HGW-Wallbacteria-1]
MMRALWSATTGMNAQEMNINTISNNLANISTAGFKKGKMAFEDLLYQYTREPGSAITQDINTPNGIYQGHGVAPVSVDRVFSQGEIERTENPFDIMIEGDGFFQILMPNGQLAYTRDGGFKVDAQGQVVNANGLLLQPAITIPQGATEFTVGIDGTASVNVGNARQELGNIQIARFINSRGLRSVGGNLYVETAASGAPQIGQPGIDDGYGAIRQGYIERSNVKAVEEMVGMIVAQRAYELNSRVIQTSDAMLQTATQLKR